MPETQVAAGELAGTVAEVAPLLPATAPAPEPSRQVGFIKALLLFWLLPRRYGPHLAVGSWTRALAAHALALLFTLTVVGYAAIGEPAVKLCRGYGLHGLRVTVARLVVDCAARTASWNWSALPTVAPLVALPLLELGVVLIAVMIMPWCAGGDSSASVFKRSLKNVYWTTTSLIPGTVVWVLLHEAISRSSPKSPNLFIGGLLFGALPILGLLALRALLTGASRYVGPPTGPAFAPCEPLCDECGYRIIGLPLTTNCPECGTPVRDSLPGGRRKPTLWQLNEFTPRGFADLARLQWRVIGAREFFKRLPVHEGLSAARHFWWTTYLGLIAVPLAAAKVIAAIPFAEGRLGRTHPQVGLLIAVGAVGIPFFFQTAMMFAGCLWAQLRLGMRDYRVSAIVCYYAAPFLWPLTLLMLAAAVLLTSPLEPMLRGLYQGKVLGCKTNGVDLTAIGLAALAFAALSYGWLRLCGALRAVRYANV